MKPFLNLKLGDEAILNVAFVFCPLKLFQIYDICGIFVFRHSGGDEGNFWIEKKQNLEDTLKSNFADDEIDLAENDFLEKKNQGSVNWSPKKERLLQQQGSPILRAPGGDLRGWGSEKDVGRGLIKR